MSMSRADCQRGVRQRRKNAGLCVRCGGPNSTPETINCPPCRDRASQEQRARYQADIEKHRQRGIEYARRARLRAIEAYGGACVCCGETHTTYLQFDHIHGDGRRHLKQERRMLHNILKREGWPDYIQLLCANCHQAKTVGEPCPPHPSRSAQ